MNDMTLNAVRDYYGRTLQSSADLKTDACCPLESPPGWVQRLQENIHPEVLERFYGCGSPIPDAIAGCCVLDLGCGSGRDAFMLSQLVGTAGEVIGIDMTPEQLEVANSHVEWHMDRFGYKEPNIRFLEGYIEDLSNLADNSVDVVISNCVINLSPSKPAVFAEIFRVLKPGGELYFSDVFASQRIPEQLREDPVLLGECLAGALYIEDFRRMISQVGVLDYRVMSRGPLTIEDESIHARIGMIEFQSMTIRAFKVELEDLCENYGHVAIYQGGIPNSPHAYRLDDHHVFRKGLPEAVCGNTANMLSKTRLASVFDVHGDFSVHYGEFDCAPGATVGDEDQACC